MRHIFIFLIGTMLTSCTTRGDRADSSASNEDCFPNIDTTTIHESQGCAGGFLYKHLGNRRYLLIDIDRERVKLKASCSTYQLENGHGEITVRLEIFNSDSLYATNYCTDLIFVNINSERRTYVGKEGLVTYSVTDGVNVKVEGLTLTDTLTNESLFIDREILFNVDVSNYPG
jgi:hypothetical protein